MKKRWMTVVENLTPRQRRKLEENADIVHDIIRELAYMDKDDLNYVLDGCRDMSDGRTVYNRGVVYMALRCPKCEMCEKGV